MQLRPSPIPARTLVVGLCATSLVALSSCSSRSTVNGGNGGGSDGIGGGETASLTFAITDAASDELASFEIEVSEVLVARASGSPVSLLPEPITVDLTQLEDLSQIVNIRQVPAGFYTAAAITFDFSDAAVFLIGETTPATILNSDGLPLIGELTLPLSFGFTATAGTNALLECDFDLNRSVMVDVASNVVTVEPVLSLELNPTTPREVLVMGALETVGEAEGIISIETRTLSGTPIAQMDLAVDTETIYQINGVPFVGADGLAALAAEAADTWVQGYGAIDTEEARFLAEYLEVGTGTYNGGSDIIEGHVIGRVGGAGTDPILTVLGRSNSADHSAFQFNTQFTVTVDRSETKVLRRGASSSGDADNINIGQRIRAFGTLAGSTLDASDETAVIRSQPTRFLGFASAAPTGDALQFDLVRIGLRDEALFLFDEGGTTPLDPDALVADVSGLLAGIEPTDLEIGAGTAVELHGFVPAIDDDEADFDAYLLINRDNAPSLLSIHDRIGGMVLAPSVSGTVIEVGVVGQPGLFEHAIIDRGFVGIEDLPNSPVPRVVPQGTTGLYSIRRKGTLATSLFLDFGEFADALETELGQTAIFNFGAIGPYDAATNTTRAGLVSVVVN